MKRGTITHHKTVDLARRLGIERWGAVGILESLWHATAERTPQGDIGKLSDDEISYYVGWSGDASTLVRALVDSRWLNECNTHRLLVHDWHDHADDTTKKRLSRNGIEFLTGHVQSVTGNVQTCLDKSATVPDKSACLSLSQSLSQSQAITTPEPPAGGVSVPNGNQCRGVSETDRKAAEDALSAWSQADRQTPLLAHRNEMPPVWAALEEIRDMRPVPTPAGSMPAVSMVARAIDAKRAERTKFKTVKFALGCVKAQLDEWASTGYSNGKAPQGESAIMRKARAMEAEAAKGAKQ